MYIVLVIQIPAINVILKHIGQFMLRFFGLIYVAGIPISFSFSTYVNKIYFNVCSLMYVHYQIFIYLPF